MDVDKLLQTVSTWGVAWTINIAAAVLIFLIGKWLARYIAGLVTRIFERNEVDVTLIRFFYGIIYYALLAVVLIAAAAQLGIQTSSFLALIGAAGLGVGLALKDSLSHFASGIQLILLRPYRVGDVVTVAGITGKVEQIDMVNTMLTTGDNQQVIIPNGSITSSVITNINANPTRRVELTVGIGYQDDVDKAKRILTDLLHTDDRILADPAPTVSVTELADSSVNLAIRPWVKTADYWDVRFDLTEKIKDAFDKEGISIPFPQREVHLVAEAA
jgi:small conductance mechanosensitive channel